MSGVPNLDDLLGPARGQVAPPALTVAVPRQAGGDISAMGAFDGAQRFDDAMALWDTPLRSADADILPDKEVLDGRARSLFRNDAFIQGGASLHKDNIVGQQFLLNARPTTRVLWGKDDDVWEEEFQEEVEQLFELYAESPDNWVDASRNNSFTSLIRLMVGVHLAGGEILAAVEWDRTAPDFSTCIQMIEADRLSTDHNSILDPSVRAGIRRNSRGEATAYQIRTEHFRDVSYSFAPSKWKEVPARKPWGRLQVIHLYEQTRPDQTRGISELSAALKETYITHKWRDLMVQQAVAQATYAAVITSELPAETVFAQLGGGEMSAAQMQGAINNYATGYLSEIAKYVGASKNLNIDGVKVPHLYPGTKFEIQSPQKGGPLGSAFEQSLIRYMAASLGVSYEQLSRDYTNTNYSSARAAMNETWKFMQARKKVIADRAASIIYRLFIEEAINNNRLSSFPKNKAPLLYTNGRLNLKFDALTRCDWIGASRGQIDEYKETQAAVLRINNGLSTAEDELARLGKDWRKVYRQLQREQSERDARGLIFNPKAQQVRASKQGLAA